MGYEFYEEPQAILFRCMECGKLRPSQEAQAVEVADTWAQGHGSMMPQPLFTGKFICMPCLAETRRVEK